MSTPQNNDAPLQDFSQCHAGIFKKLDMLGELPALLAPAARAREIAEKSLEFFREAIFEHHLDEERELFPAVIADAVKGGAQLPVIADVGAHGLGQARVLELNAPDVVAAFAQFGD